MRKNSILVLGSSLLVLAACRHDSPAPTPTIAFTLPAGAEATVAVPFQNASQNATAYKWSFGDGSTDRTTSPTHTYATAGTYQVTLHAYGAQQDSAAVTKSLTVTDYQVFTHASAKIAGIYDCRVYRGVDYYPTPNSGGSSTFTRRRDTVLTVVATGPQTLTLNGASGSYMPNPNYLVNPNGPGYPFKINLAEYSIAHFYSVGDSLLLTEWSHVGHAYTTTDYYRAKRRP